MSDTLVSLKDVSKEYPSPVDGPSVDVLKSVSLDIAPGERAAIVGPSGSGKSTLLNMAGALDMPTSGLVSFMGKNINTLSEDDCAHLRAEHIGFVFQLHHLLPQCSVIENILIPTMADGVSADGANERAAELIERVGLGERVDHRPAELSGGERQRAAVVRALINKPELLCADEPTGSLDHDSSLDLVKLLVELSSEQNMALIMVTHSIELAENMDRIYSLQDGTLRDKS